MSADYLRHYLLARRPAHPELAAAVELSCLRVGAVSELPAVCMARSQGDGKQAATEAAGLPGRLQPVACRLVSVHGY